jgi:hypothetical protein
LRHDRRHQAREQQNPKQREYDRRRERDDAVGTRERAVPLIRRDHDEAHEIDRDDDARYGFAARAT